MSHEICYTSAPQGLKPGSQGFSTVISTSGIAKNLAEQLEGLSGYRHAYAPHDPSASLNPVVHMHVRLMVGGRPFHVLSRIADAGIDYTQRTNKFAHHVALEPAELSPAGPAAVLSCPGFMQTTWDGAPKMLVAGRTPPALAAEPRVCAAWQQLTGDAGWGGVLAETIGGTASPGPKRQAVLIFRPGMDCLPLVAEALALLPPAERWGVTFSTYFTKLPPGIECRWRCILEGSPEAAQIQRSPAMLVLDLCRPMGAASGGLLVEGARTGRVSWPKVVAAAPPPRDVSPAAPAPTNELELALAEEARAPVAPATVAVSEGDTAGEPLRVGPPPRRRDLPSSPPARQKGERPKWFWAAGGALGMAVIAGVALIAYSAGRSTATPDVVAKTDTDKPVVPEKKADPPKIDPPKIEPPVVPVDPPKPLDPLPTAGEEKKHEVAPVKQEPATTPVAPTPPFRKAVRLPPIPASETGGPAEPVRLLEIERDVPFDLEVLTFANKEDELVVSKTAPQSWKIANSKESAEWANVFVDGTQLMFRWAAARIPGPKETAIRTSLLRVTGPSPGVIALREPTRAPFLDLSNPSIALATADSLKIPSLLLKDCKVQFFITDGTDYKRIQPQEEGLVLGDPNERVSVRLSQGLVGPKLTAAIKVSKLRQFPDVKYRGGKELRCQDLSDIAQDDHRRFYDDENKQCEATKNRIVRKHTAKNGQLMPFGPEDMIRWQEAVDEIRTNQMESMSLDPIANFWRAVSKDAITYRILLPVSGNEHIELVSPSEVKRPPPITPMPAPLDPDRRRPSDWRPDPAFKL